MAGALSDLGEAIRGDDKELAEREARELRRRRFRHLAGPRFAPDPARAMSTGGAPVRAALSRFGRTIGHLVGGQDYHDRLRTATFAREPEASSANFSVAVTSSAVMLVQSFQAMM